MPAAVRGGSQRKPARGGGQGRGKRAPAAYAPAKLRGANGVGLRPQAALAAAGFVLVGGVALMLGTGGRGQALAQAIHDGVDARLGAAGFRIAEVEIKGASAVSEPTIRQALGVSVGTPILGLDLAALRDRVEQVGWIETATVQRHLPDIIAVEVTERPRLAVWQSKGVTNVIDPEGHVIPEADAAQFADLPLVVGEGAAEAASVVLPLVQSRPRLAAQLEALVRVDGRRWDIRLKDGGLIQLPASGEDAALIQLDQLDQRSRILELGFARIDLRDPQMVAVRPRDGEGAGA